MGWTSTAAVLVAIASCAAPLSAQQQITAPPPPPSKLDHHGPDPFRDEKIVGGTPSRPLEFPFLVGVTGSTWGSPFCGATLISPTEAICAAHCNPSADDVVSVNSDVAATLAARAASATRSGDREACSCT